MPKPTRTPEQSDAGFTMVELLVVMVIMTIVLVIAGSSLISFSNVTTRNSAMIDTEQAASTTLAQMARDIRSAHSITFVTSTSNAAISVVLNENQPSGTSTQPVEWLYTPPSGSAVVGTLSRVILNTNLTVKSNEILLTNLTNSSSNPVFTYYDLQGQPMSTTDAGADQTLQNCTTAIGVNLVISPSPVPGVANYSESNAVALTDQQQILSAPGNGQC